jgi:hypothetical protein
MKRYMLSFRISLLILSAFVFSHCYHGEQETSVSMISENEKVVGLRIRGFGPVEDDLPSRLKVQLIKPGLRAAVLGDYKINDEEIIFEPLVPFTRGLTYEILIDDSVVAEIGIPLGSADAPELLSIYPTQDTVPENLLKMYFEFSEPMVEGNSLSHIVLIKNDKDTLEGTFLDLEPELWNQEGTVLTFWLDPGRIKRDLIPNKELGSPLGKGNKYTLHISDSWKSKKGFSLSKAYSKDFITVSRDSTCPSVLDWKIVIPRPNTTAPLEIQFQEALDQFTLGDGISIIDIKTNKVDGVVKTFDEERIFRFLPNKRWLRGEYTIRIETRIEDLSGNNLNRPFERDFRQTGTESQDSIFLVKGFEIR